MQVCEYVPQVSLFVGLKKYNLNLLANLKAVGPMLQGERIKIENTSVYCT
jgi:hypothetical protein